MNHRALDRREFLQAGSAAALACASAACASTGSNEPELVLRGGELHDGLGSPPQHVDVGVRAGRIVRLGAIEPPRHARVLDVSGLCVAPGFVDIHTHSDHSIFEWPQAQSRILQGVTTEITGNCGSSAAPREGNAKPDEDGGSQPIWTDLNSYADAWRTRGAALNQVMLVGHGTLRSAVIGDVFQVAGRVRYVGASDSTHTRIGSEWLTPERRCFVYSSDFDQC